MSKKKDTTHFWGDKNFDWDMLTKAMDYIITNCHDRARVHLSIKEKYGTIRYEAAFNIENNGYFNDFKPITSEQRKMVNEIVHEAGMAYPDVYEEIMEDFDLECL